MRESIEWPPTKVPPKFPLTPYKDGWCKTIGGKWRHVCGKLAPAKARAEYERKMTEGKFADGRRVAVVGGSALTCKGLANLYGVWLQQRLDPTLKLKKLDPRTLADYHAAIQLFLDTEVGDLRIADVRVEELTPADFAAALVRIPGKSPSTRSRHVAAIKAMFRWAGPERAGHIQRMPAFGADFAKASKDELREARADLTKSFDAAELRTLVQASMHTRVWWPLMLLSLNGAFSNIELARLRRDQIDLEAGEVRSVRGKKGRAYRRTTLWPATIAALKAYVRPDPALTALADLFFLTREGMPYSRAEIGRTASGAIDPAKIKRKDTLAVDFGKFVAAAGLPREGRSFSGLRTTFRTEAESMTPLDDDAIDLVMGHPRKHISSEYVERFPGHRLQAVTDHVFISLFGGWAIKIDDRPTRRVQRWTGRPRPAKGKRETGPTTSPASDET